ncbi:LCP family glycopolymer transferase [Shouchella patagoniensis]|uniref:LCP family glycopolymer transferase n=1 Tax=Shouchella patagoniensis TaxID=228576 RepID=UPI000994D348|nr:LCP family protein [Shouchella patagoniensis]
MKWYTKTIIVLLSVGLFAIGAYAFSLFQAASNANEEMYEPLESRTKSEGASEQREASASPGEPLSFLIAGVDSHEEDGYGRADALLIVTVNAQDESIQIVSIPRDTRAEIVGHGTFEKINHAYAYGGADMTIQTVEELFHIPIDHYLAIDMDQFIEMVDTLGGITVENDFAFSLSGHDFPEGVIELNGEEALAYVRMRKEDPEGDAGRTKRQRDVLEGVIEEGLQVSQMSSAPDLLRSLGSTLQTDLTVSKMASYAQNYYPAASSISQIELEFSEETIDGAWYALISEEERARVSQNLLNHLGLDETTNLE